MNPWDLVKTKLQGRLSTEAYANWVARTAMAGVDLDVLKVAVPDEATRECMQSDYAVAVQTAVSELHLPYGCIVYEVGDLENGGAAAASFGTNVYRQSEGNLDAMFQPAAVQLNRKFTFDSFVVGPCNQFAHAAAQAVATMPSRSYNPLFIYGNVGMGKTHLMHAIGRSLIENYAGMRIVYTTSERFINLMIQCIKIDRMQEFHRHFRSADVLLIDDIQFLGNKERTQDELFYTFNELYEHQKQIVISSDSQPKQVPGLVERLRSRFEWGLMVDVQPPDLETKMAIVDKKAEQEGICLPEDVRVFIATKIKTNMRELEGALVKLIAYASMSQNPITLSMAQQVLKHMVTGSDKKPTIDAIIRAVADRYSLQPLQLKQKTNSWKISRPRQIAMYLAKELTQASLPEIGRAFGGKHHTTVLHSIQKVERDRVSDPDLNRIIHNVIDSFH